MPPTQPSSNIATAEPDKELSLDDITSALSEGIEANEDDEIIPDTLGDLKIPDDDDEEEKDDKKKKDDKEEDEIKIETTDDELELVTPPHRAEILKAFPELFKKFPFIEKALGQEKQYTEIFGTIDDAKEVKDRADEYGKFETDLMQGNINGVFKSLKTANEEAFAEVVDNLLPTLAKVDQNAYQHILGDVIKKTLISAVRSSQALDEETGEQLKLAASIIHQFVFGPGQFIPPSKFNRSSKPTDNIEKQKLDNERSEFTRQRFNVAQDELDGRVENLLKNTINTNIDPKNAMSSYVKRTAIRESMELLRTTIAKDERFQNFKDRLWQKSYEQGFNRDSLKQIQSAYLSKAKTLLPSVIKKIRAEALNSQGRTENNDRPRNRDTKPTESTPAQKNSGEKGKVPKGMSTLEFLNS